MWELSEYALLKRIYTLNSADNLGQNNKWVQLMDLCQYEVEACEYAYVRWNEKKLNLNKLPVQK